MAKILLLEDDDTIAFGIKASLEKKNHVVCCYSTITEAKKKFDKDINLILLDLNLPDGIGYEFCKYVKNIRDIPVIFLTVRDDEKDIVQGLDMGADDYVVKPFLLSVLQSRINAVLRRTHSNTTSTLTCENIRLNKDEVKVYLDNIEISLTAGEYKLLLSLMENKNKALTRAKLLEMLWDIDGNFVNDNTLTVTIKRLREKLKNPSCIKTLRGIGYRMEDS
ncbi:MULTISPECIES: response regulator transcription factor [unclassified Clostridioides]|uniref:response regulator transcription factor n=1 Tax=unclassified Clostridioides TaxID=2635829 RepID=UPI001D0C4AF5|nr:response regulator transcription factor [Clostridioides sp. ES-S-0001-02]MCC0641938.1 response regulator transcription factor [Clostridioides sp. ES-S-0049-03]MCC0653991.1 response regulator transcription factor [Clostridioides sp. ES-S-0001-03]MCC0656392.1 response regulator transcription factor [Clostridioides sp. ES-S-0123-01]MCC0674383.1 response regulator transcription factor [Clostridioides sp. ES-S-0145-01]MCC0678073.1 response regulator transcription factor [Clostridioides sp. ES-W-